jgi:hypothetical protein
MSMSLSAMRHVGELMSSHSRPKGDQPSAKPFGLKEDSMLVAGRKIWRFVLLNVMFY